MDGRADRRRASGHTDECRWARVPAKDHEPGSGHWVYFTALGYAPDVRMTRTDWRGRATMRYAGNMPGGVTFAAIKWLDKPAEDSEGDSRGDTEN